MRTILKTSPLFVAALAVAHLFGCDVDTGDDSTVRAAYEVVEWQQHDDHARAVVELGGDVLHVVAVDGPLPSVTVARPEGDTIVAVEHGTELRYTRFTAQGAVEALSASELEPGGLAVIEDALAGELVDPASEAFRLMQDPFCVHYASCTGGCSATASHCYDNQYANPAYCEGQMDQCHANCIDVNSGCF